MSTASASISPRRWGASPAFDRNAPFFAAIRQDPVLANVKLIAEPWDIGAGRLSGRRLPQRLVGMERSSIARPCAASGSGEGSLLGDMARAHDRLADPVPTHDGRSPRRQHQSRHRA